MNQTLRGIVIHNIKYKESSYICRIFMEHHGMKTFLIQTRKSSKSSKPNLLQPMMLVEFEAAIKENVQINQLKDLRIAVPLSEAYFNPVKSAILLFLDEVLYKTIPDDYVNQKLYKLLWESVQQLDDAIDARNFHIWCLLEISRHYGFYPFSDDTEVKYFDMVTASFCKERPSHFNYIDGESCQALFAMLDQEWLQIQPVSLHSSIRKKLLESLVTFLKLHLENLREIKSLSVLHEVFH